MLYLRPEFESDKHADWIEVDANKIALENTYLNPKPPDHSGQDLDRILRNLTP